LFIYNILMSLFSFMKIDRFINTDRMKLSFIIFRMLYFYLLIDMVNGVFLRMDFISISIFYKTIILSLVFVELRNQKYLYFPFIFFAIFFISHYMIVNDIWESISGLNWLFKFYFIYWLYLFFKNQIEKGHFNEVVKVIQFCTFFVIVNTGLGILGFGYAQYGEDIGVQGFIYAGNELAITIVCCFGFILMDCLVKNQYRNFLFFAILFLLIALFSALKAAMFGAFLILLFFPVLKLFDKILSLKIHWKNALLSFFTIVMLPIAIFSGGYFVLFHLGLWNRISYFYYTRGLDVMSVILSNRNVWAKEAIEGSIENYSFFEWLFGTSKEWLVHLNTPGKGSIEIDLLDILLIYGFVGVFLTYGHFIRILFVNIKYRRLNPYSKYTGFLILLILLISLTAGHVFYSGVGGPIISAVLAVTFYSIQNENNI